MTKNEQITYLLQLNLQGLKKTESGYNFRCPICGDSKKNISKKRCWALTRKDPNNLIVYCHNCGYSSNFKFFLKNVNSYLFSDYIKKEKEEKINDIKEGRLLSKAKPQGNINIDTPIKYQFKLNKKYFKPAKDFKQAVEFCKKRDILDQIDDLYYCVHPKNLCSGMVIFPCYMPDGETLYAFSARHTDFKRFYIHSKNESFKVFNIFGVDKNENVFIFESIIDSYTMTNSIAALGSDISENILKLIKNPIFIFDNDTTGRKKTLKYLQNGYRCFIPPDDFRFKDFNEAICNGWSKDQINRMVHENIFRGFSGIARINFKLMRKQ